MLVPNWVVPLNLRIFSIVELPPKYFITETRHAAPQSEESFWSTEFFLILLILFTLVKVFKNSFGFDLSMKNFCQNQFSIIDITGRDNTAAESVFEII